MSGGVRLAPALAALGTLAAVAIAVPALSSADRPDPVKVTSQLKGKHTEPGPGDPDGAGKIVLLLRADKRRICFRLDVDALNLLKKAHLHAGGEGELGPEKLELFSDQAGLDGNGNYNGCIKRVKRGLLEGLASTPEQYYVDVHTNGYPQGALRGQLKARG